jgi:hypothetical protein
MEPEVCVELLRLLARVAAVDDDIAAEEIQLILSVGQEAGVEPLLLETFRATLQAGETLGAPDVDALRPHEALVRRHAFALVAADGVFEEEEMEALKLIDEVFAGKLA